MEKGFSEGPRHRKETIMTRATIAPPAIKTLADLRKRLGGISLDRIWFHPAPGTATEKDVLEVEAREDRLCELVDGTLVEKAIGFEEARPALRLVADKQPCALTQPFPSTSTCRQVGLSCSQWTETDRRPAQELHPRAPRLPLCDPP